ncbi:hypothetical protein HDU93_006768, partial [Gonapodya sp. JEL0774]
MNLAHGNANSDRRLVIAEVVAQGFGEGCHKGPLEIGRAFAMLSDADRAVLGDLYTRDVKRDTETALAPVP